MVRVRFAPSPTGRLHLGNARTAVLNALFARHHGGVFLLRIDDTDITRCRSEYLNSIKEDLHWLGLHWDEEFCQSDRVEKHIESFMKLQKSGRIYPCFETVEELDALRKDQLSRNLPPIYDRIKGQSVPVHDAPYWRFALEDKSVEWNDAICGPMQCYARHLSDPVVMRCDGSMSYLLSSVIDDVDTDITHIIRGADHLTNTTIQIQMIEALNKPVPVWAHFPLMLDEHGNKFSKRTGSKTLQELRQEGYFPMAIVQALTQLGLSHNISGSFSEIVSAFSLADYSTSNATFSLKDIDRIQSKMWATFDHEALPSDVRDHITPELWPIVRDNVVQASDIAHWQNICSNTPLDISFSLHLDTALPLNFFALALEILEQCGAIYTKEKDLMWADHAWHGWINALVKVCPGFKKGVLCRALRYALTGQEGGPKMETLLPMIPVKSVILRMQNAIHHGQ